MHVAGKSFERVMKHGEVVGQSVACGDGQHINIFISSGCLHRPSFNRAGYNRASEMPRSGILIVVRTRRWFVGV